MSEPLLFIPFSCAKCKRPFEQIALVELFGMGIYACEECISAWLYDKKWISVKVDLPKDKQDVVVYDGYSTYLTWFEEKKDRRTKKRRGEFMNLNNDFESVTHWIPYYIPPLPEKE